MLGAIAGDMIGSRFEGQPGPFGDFVLYHPSCRFTDDSICTLAIADALLTDSDFAASLRAFVRRHPNRGYGPMFLGWALSEDAPAYGSWANGAAMRTAAVGWLANDEASVMQLAAAQAAVTHNHEEAIAGAQAVALSIYLLREDATPSEVLARIGEEFGYDLGRGPVARSTEMDVSALGTVPPAIAAALTSDSWEAAVRAAIDLGGDTDTLACMAGAVAEALHDIPEEIRWWSRVNLSEDLADVLSRFELALD